MDLLQRIPQRITRITLSLIVFALMSGGLFAQIKIQLKPLGDYQTGLFDEGAMEIVAHDPATQRLFVVNAFSSSVDVLDVSNPNALNLLFSIDLAPYGNQANSVDVKNGVLVAAVEADDKQAPGKAVFFDTDGNYLNDVTVGALPDMVTFSPDGNYVLTANEGEPSGDYLNDPEGSISVIDISGGIASATVMTADFSAFNGAVLDASIRIFGPNASVAQDLEPEYIAISDDSQTAYVTCQENNALAIVDIPTATVTALKGLGFKDHMMPGNGLDASDRDDAINIANWPVKGLYLPDAIAGFTRNGMNYLITANEGDARDYDAFAEEERVKDLTLDPTAFPNAADLQENEAIGRLTVTTTIGDTDNDGDYDELYVFGARSFTIWAADGSQVFDSGDQLERIIADSLPNDFNATNDENDTFDNRSDNKGPEPEGVAIGVIGGRTFAFIGLERVGGIVVYDVTDPHAPVFCNYVNTRDFSGDVEAGTAGDSGPEGLKFIPKKDSPINQPLLAVAYEISGSLRIFAVEDIVSPFALLANDDISLNGQKDSFGALHANDYIRFHKGAPSTHTGNLSAVEEIEIARRNTIYGNVTAGEEIENDGDVFGSIDENAAVPFIALPVLNFVTGGSDITVPRRGELELAPGNYGSVQVKERATLKLTTGEYYFDELEIEEDAELVADVTCGPVSVYTRYELDFENDSKVTLLPLGDSESHELYFFSKQTKELDIDSDAKVSGSIIAPYAEVEIGEKAWFKGSISADEIVVKKHATFAPHDMFMPAVTKLGKATGDIADAIPGSYELEQNYPNPFNPTTTIRYQLPENSTVKLQIYNMLGQVVNTLVSGNQQAGRYTVNWDGTSQFGEKVASGVYIYRLQAGAFSQTRKMMLLK